MSSTDDVGEPSDSSSLAPGTVATYSKDVSWYVPGPPTVSPAMTKLLQEWSGIGPDSEAIASHVEAVREAAWKVHPYPCIGGYRFLGLGLFAHPSFNAVVDILTTPTSSGSLEPLFVDLGCCVGQDIRSLIYAGVPGSRVVGAELESAFIEIGYELFRDREKLGVRFLSEDVLALEDSGSTDLASESLQSSAREGLFKLIGYVSVIWTSAFLHLWDLSGQMAVCRKILLLLRDEPGVRALGRQLGSRIPHEKKHVTNKGGLMYKHSPESFRKMWGELLGQTGTQGDEETSILGSDGSRWEVQAWLEDDHPFAVQQRQKAGLDSNTNSDWLTKVSRATAGQAEGDQASREKTAFLVWEVRRAS